MIRKHFSLFRKESISAATLSGGCHSFQTHLETGQQVHGDVLAVLFFYLRMLSLREIILDTGSRRGDREDMPAGRPAQERETEERDGVYPAGVPEDLQPAEGGEAPEEHLDGRVEPEGGTGAEAEGPGGEGAD